MNFLRSWLIYSSVSGLVRQSELELFCHVKQMVDDLFRRLSHSSGIQNALACSGYGNLFHFCPVGGQDSIAFRFTKITRSHTT